MQAKIRLEKKSDFAKLEVLQSEIFGEAQKVRAAYSLRENVSHELALSFVAENKGKLIGMVRQSKIFIGESKAWLLGPLGVLPEYKNLGIGKTLMKKSISQAKELASEKTNPQFILLVGDLDYYAAFGFATAKNIALPRPVDETRILICNLNNNLPLPTGKSYSILTK